MDTRLASLHTHTMEELELLDTPVHIHVHVVTKTRMQDYE